MLIEPGIADIQKNSDDLLIGLDVAKGAEAKRGKAWKRIDIVFGPRPDQPRRPTLRELNDMTAARIEYERTKHSRFTDPALR